MMLFVLLSAVLRHHDAVCSFCSQLFCVVMMLFSIIFYHPLINDPVIIVAYVFTVSTVSFGLALTVAGGITVHHYVSVFSVITFRVSRRRREMYIGHARMCLTVSVCAVCPSPHSHTTARTQM